MRSTASDWRLFLLFAAVSSCQTERRVSQRREAAVSEKKPRRLCEQNKPESVKAERG